MTATAHEGRVGKNWLESVQSLFASAIRPLNKDSDKDAVAAMQALSHALQYSHSLDFETLHQLVTCDTDGVGRIYVPCTV